jgi:hypothetical protein
MGFRSLSQQRVAGESAIASGIGVYASLTSGGGYNLSGQSLTTTTAVTQTAIIPGQSSDIATSNVGSIVATIDAVYTANINYGIIGGPVFTNSYIVVSGTGFIPTGYLTLNGVTLAGNVYYSSTQLRANLNATSNITIIGGNLTLAYYFPPILIKSSNLYITPLPSFSYMVVAGGGGGSYGIYGGGGGGAGGYLTGSGIFYTQGLTYTITVGGGGIYNNLGNNSNIYGPDITTITAVGGGYGGAYRASAYNPGGNGGSGGGAGGSGQRGIGVYPGSTYLSQARQGYDGGSGYSGSNQGGGGGGGAGAAGANGVSGAGGVGGAGIINPFPGSTAGANVSGIYYLAGGGSGGLEASGANVAGGYGGGGRGATGTYIFAENGTTNTGGGGGGSTQDGNSGVGGTGGSGVVVLQIPITVTATSTTGSPTVTTSGIYKYYTYTSSGTIVF